MKPTVNAARSTVRRRGLLAAAFLIAVFLAGPAPATEVQRVVSAQGIEAWLVEDHTNPILSVRFAFRGGASLDPRGKEGLARMVSALLDEGAGDLDSQAFQRRLEDLSVRLRFSAGRDTFSGRLTTLTRNREKAFDLLRLALTAPRFDKEAVERIRSQMIAGLKNDLENPETIASRTMMRRLFPGHPYGHPVSGTIESVSGLEIEDLKAFAAERLARANLVIGVVGDVEPAALKTLLDKSFAKLQKDPKPFTVENVAPVTNGKVELVKKTVPGSAIVFAQKGLKRNDPDFYTAFVLNHILGSGGFTSRLYTEVREKRGLVYNVGTGLVPLDHAAILWGSAGTSNDRAVETLKLVRAEWQRLAEKGVGEDELKDTKTYLTGSFPLRFTSSGRIAAMLVGMQLDDLGIDYIDKRNGYIEAVTLDGVNDLARRLLDSRRLSFVVVGDPKKIEEAL